MPLIAGASGAIRQPRPAVAWLRSQPDQVDFLRACYRDQPEIETAERFLAGDEWDAVLHLLPPPTGRALDLGGGNVIASYALARSGWDVVAAEPSSSAITGGATIAALLESAGHGATVVAAVGDQLPFADAAFGVVYSRQVLHHVGDPAALCGEVRRVLRPGGAPTSPAPSTSSPVSGNARDSWFSTP